MAGKMAILKAPNCGCQTVRDYKNWADLQNGQIGCEIGHFGCNQTPPKSIPEKVDCTFRIGQADGKEPRIRIGNLI